MVTRELGLKSRLKGQSTLEVAILIFCIVAAVLTMSVYLKRSMQGRLRQGADEMGVLYSPGATTGISSKTLSRQACVESYLKPATIKTNTGEEVEGRYLYRRENILRQDIQEDVDETVQ